jgi:cellulose synthase/poly-beta-1,6-N-acetylglucosamine synthase-like glycosyltransferase
MIAQLVEKHDKKVTRILEIIPGLLTWMVILSPLWLGILYPKAIVVMLIFLTVYWFYMALKGTIGGFRGYRKFKQEISTDWAKEVQKLDFSVLPDKATLPPSLQDVKHLILIPMVNEGLDVIDATLSAILRQTFPVNQITLVLTIEEKYFEQSKANILEILKDDVNKFEEVLIYCHPRGIPGEAIGAGAANRTWGAKHAVEHLIEQNKPIRNYIFTTIDADHVLHDQYIARLSHLYLSCDKRDYKYYSSAVYLFNNNLWKVPAIMRTEANFVTFGTLSDWAGWHNPNTKDTFAAYSTSLQTLIDANYWDTSLGIDDTIFYWRAFFARNGEFLGMHHYIPFSADAVAGTSYINAHKSLYKQLLRWGYGVIDFPLSVKEFLKNDKIPLSLKISWVVKHLHKRVILVNLVFLITFGFTITTIVNPDVKQTIFAYSLPNLMSMILGVTMVFLIPGIILRSKISTPMPEEWPFWKKLLMFLESPLVLINLLTFSFIPYVDAQTRVLLGKKLKDLYHTPKVRQ